MLYRLSTEFYAMRRIRTDKGIIAQNAQSHSFSKDSSLNKLGKSQLKSATNILN